MPRKAKQQEAATEPAPEDHHRTLRILCHALALFTAFLGTLIVWLLERGKSAEIDEHGRAVLNFVWTVMLVQLVMFIAAVVFLMAAIDAVAYAFFGVWLLLLIVAWVFLAIGTLRAIGTGPPSYPLSIHFLK
jgi:hypothetical protein